MIGLTLKRLSAEQTSARLQPVLQIFFVILTDAMLKFSGDIPLNDHRFMVCAIEIGVEIEIFSPKIPYIGRFNVMDMKRMILEVLA
jgi:hypothetical protein